MCHLYFNIMPMDQDTQTAFNGMMASMNATAANIGTRKQMERAQKNSLELMEKQQEYYDKNYERAKKDAYEREDFLNANSKRIEVDAMRKAGLNPAWNESSGIVSQSVGSADGAMPTPSYYHSEAPEVSGINAFNQTAMMAKQIQLLDAQIKSVNEDTRGKSLANNATEDENNTVQLTQYLMLGDKADIDDDGQIWVDFGNGQTIRADQLPKTKKGYEALNSFNTYRRNKYVTQTEEDKALLDDIVSKLQVNDDDVLKALSSMPTEVIRELKAKNTMQEMENEITSASKDVWRSLEDKPAIIKFLASAFYTFVTKK